MTTVDSFIESSLELLAAYPSSALVSITYSNELKKVKSNTMASNNEDKKASNSVTVKVYEPSSGKCIKYKTYKTKELSKLLTFLGPKGVTLTQSLSKSKSKKRSSPVNNNDDSKRIKVDNHIAGLASVMSNKAFDTDPVVPQTGESTIENPQDVKVPEAGVEPETNSKNKKKKKKKSKK